MKKTIRNQNMPEETGGNKRILTSSATRRQVKPVEKERFRDSNLTPVEKGKKQRYDDFTGTVENQIG